MFLSEWIPFKQNHLKRMCTQLNTRDPCLFSDATKVFSDERECVRHNDACVSWLDMDGGMFRRLWCQYGCVCLI